MTCSVRTDMAVRRLAGEQTGASHTEIMKVFMASHTDFDIADCKDLTGTGTIIVSLPGCC